MQKKLKVSKIKRQTNVARESKQQMLSVCRIQSLAAIQSNPIQSKSDLQKFGSQDPAPAPAPALRFLSMRAVSKRVGRAAQKIVGCAIAIKSFSFFLSFSLS